MESLINELVKDIVTNFFNIYVIVFILVNFYNCIKIIGMISQITIIMKQQNEINNKINKLYIIKEDREAFIKSIVVKYIEENNGNKDYLKLIEKQNKQLSFLKKRINKLDEILNNNNIF